MLAAGGLCAALVATARAYTSLTVASPSAQRRSGNTAVAPCGRPFSPCSCLLLGRAGGRRLATSTADGELSVERRPRAGHPRCPRRLIGRLDGRRRSSILDLTPDDANVRSCSATSPPMVVLVGENGSGLPGHGMSASGSSAAATASSIQRRRHRPLGRRQRAAAARGRRLAPSGVYSLTATTAARGRCASRCPRSARAFKLGTGDPTSVVPRPRRLMAAGAADDPRRRGRGVDRVVRLALPQERRLRRARGRRPAAPRSTQFAAERAGADHARPDAARHRRHRDLPPHPQDARTCRS